MKSTVVKHIIGALSALAVLSSAQVVFAEDMGLMRVDSTTIDDRFGDKRTESSNTSMISSEQIEKAHTESIKQLLDGIPGVTTELQSGDSLKIHIRGVENQRFMGEKPGVAVVIDGVPVFERTGRVNINMDDIESIKVIKGGASYLFGEDALAGAVIITTKRGAKMAGGYLAAEAGSFAYKRGVARAGFATDSVSGHVQVSSRSSDGYYFQGDYQADYLNGKLQGYLSDTSDLTFGWEMANRLKDSHGTVDGVTQATVDPTSIEGRDYARKFDVNLGKYYLTYANDVSDTANLMVNAYQFSDHTQFWSAPVKYDASGTPVSDIDAYAYDNDYKQIQRGLKSEWRDAGGASAWMAGLDLRLNTYDNRTAILQDYKVSPSPFSPVITAGTQTLDNQTKEQVSAVYGETKYRLSEPLTVTLNGRYDQIQLDYTDDLPGAAAPSLSKTFNVGSWRVGGTYDVSETSVLYSNISTGFRAPTVDQLFAGDISPTGNTDANPDLTPEQATNYEIGLRGQEDLLGGLSWDMALFQIDRKDFILAVAGQYANPVSGTQNQFQNIGGMRSRGLELALKTNQEQTFSMNAAYTYLDAKFTQYDNYNMLLGNRYSPAPGASTITSLNNTGNVVPRTPKHKLFLALNARATDDLTITTEVNAQSSYYADEMNVEKIGGHTTYNLIGNYELITGAQQDAKWLVFGRIDNLFDRNYYNTARGYYDSNGDFTYDAEDLSLVVNQGRSWTAGVSTTF